MKWYEITAVPFIREDTPSPWSILINSNCSVELFFLNRNNSVKLYVAVDDSSSAKLEGELKRTNHIYQLTNELTISNSINITRKIDVINYSNAEYYQIKTNKNGFDALITYLQHTTDVGFSMKVNNKHTTSKMLSFQIKQQKFINTQNCAFFNELNNSFDFSICVFSSVASMSNALAEKISSCFEGLQIEHTVNVSPFVKEVSLIATKQEVEELMSITDYLGERGFQYNNDTLTKNRPNDTCCDFYFGKSFDGRRKVGVSESELCQHVFIAGGPGSGKGNLLVNLAKQFKEKNISFLFIESAKYELHHLAKKLIPDLKVWRPEAGRFVLNPFYVPDGMNFMEYQDRLRDIMYAFFNADPNDTDSALPGLYEDAFKKCVSKYINNPLLPTQFGITEFMTEYRNLRKFDEYDNTIGKRLRTAGLNHIEASIKNEFVFDSIISMPIQELITGFNVLQLEPLDTDESKSNFAFALLSQIMATLKKKGTDNLNFVIIIDESHVLIKNTQDCQIGTYFHKMIDEFRSRGISIIVADQSADNIPNGIVNDSYTKIFLGGNDKTGITNFRNKANLDEIAYNNLFNLTAGQGIMISDNRSAGVTFVADNLIDELKLSEPCEYQNSFLENNRITIETYNECHSCKYYGTCTMQNKIEAQKFASYFYNIYDYMMSDSFVDKDSKKIIFEINTITYDMLIEKIYEITLNLSNESFGCFLKQLFRKFNSHYGNNECTQKYDELIRKILDGRLSYIYATNYYNSHKDLLKKAINVKNGRVTINTGTDKELLNTICGAASDISDNAFLFYLQQVFIKFDTEHGYDKCNDKYEKLVNAIIKRRCR